jgi:hypothetical protein
MRSHALGTPARPWVRSVFCGPAFPSACRLPSTPSAGVVRLPLSAVGLAWLSPAFPPSCPFRSAIAPRLRLLHPCSGASSVLRGSQTPCPVHRWLKSLDFPPRPMAPSAMGGVQGLPVLAHGASTHAQGLYIDRARSHRTSLSGAVGVAFGPKNGLGTWELHSISRLNTRPACTPVNASSMSSRTCPHDSGASWVASPSMCDFLLRCTTPVLSRRVF